MLKKIIPALIILIISINVGILIYSDSFNYSLDDAYIHMEIANNLAEYGIYGINNYEFTSPSSSPVWTLVLSFFILIFGNSVLIPFFLNITLSLLLIIFLIFKIKDTKKYYLILVSVISTSIPVLIINGMEHILHLLLFTFIFFKLIDNIEKYKNDFKLGENIPLIFAIMFCVLIRYETLFFIFIYCTYLLYNKKFKISIFLGILSLLPIIVFGFISYKNGSTFLPTSILLKSSISETNSIIITLHRFLFGWILNLKDQLLIITLILLSIFSLFTFKSSKYTKHLYFYLFSVLFHSYFAKFGWLYRYEAYLIFLGILINGLVIFENINFFKNTEKIKIILASIVLFIPFFYRINEANTETLKAKEKFKIQQLQMANFVSEYYNDKSVACNDIGAIAYYSDCDLIDLYGLANNDVALAKIENRNLSEVYNKLLKDKKCELIIVYDNWFYGNTSLPTEYVNVCTWESQVPIEIGEEVVTFKTLKNNVENLKVQLKEFINSKYLGNPPFKVEYYE